MKPGHYIGDKFRGYSSRHTLFRFDGNMRTPEIAELALVKLLISSEDYYKEKGTLIPYDKYLEDIKAERKIFITAKHLIPYSIEVKEVPL